MTTAPELAPWLFAPARDTNDAIRRYLRAQLLNSPLAALMGSICSLVVLLTAFYRSGSWVFEVFILVELLLFAGRVVEWRTRDLRRDRSSGEVDITSSVLLTTAWCALQGAIAFTIMSGGDPVLQVLSATLIMAMAGPICARNYAAPRFATLLLLLCDLPFVAGAIVAPEPLLALIVLLTPPFLLGAWQIIRAFHNAMLDTLFAREQSRHLAMHDSLTGILNRQGMDEKLGRLQPHSGKTMAILSLDLDGFKQINDTHGHGAGDTALMEVARRISTIAGADNIVARMGGDEFMVVMPNCAEQDARQLGQSIVAAISEDEIILKSGARVGVGASVGFACFPEDATNTLELRMRADDALYDAKGAGKGTCRRFVDGELEVSAMQHRLNEAYPKRA